MAIARKHKKASRKKSVSKKKLFSSKNLYEQKYFYILGVALLIILFVVGVKILSAHASFVGAGNGGPANPGTGTTTIVKTSNNSGNSCGQITTKVKLISALSSEFGITVKGDGSTDKFLEIYNTMCVLSQSYGKFFSNIKARGTNLGLPCTVNGQKTTCNFTINIGKTSDGTFSCLAGYTPPRGSSTNDIDMGWCGGSSPTALQKAGNRFVLVHEMGHVIIDRNNYGGVYGSYISKFGSGVTMPTFNCANAARRGLNTGHECFADMVGEFLVYKTYEHDYSMNHYRKVDTSITPNYPSGSYKNLYNFVASNVFGSGGGGGIQAAPVDQSKSCSAYLQSTACNSGPDKKSTNVIISKCTQGGSTSFSCFNPNLGHYYTQMNSCNSLPFGPNYSKSGHKFLLRTYNGVTSCLADCTAQANLHIPHCN